MHIEPESLKDFFIEQFADPLNGDLPVRVCLDVIRIALQLRTQLKTWENQRAIKELERLKEIKEAWGRMSLFDEHGNINPDLQNEGLNLEHDHLIKKYEIPVWFDPTQSIRHVNLLIAATREHGYKKCRKIVEAETTCVWRGRRSILDEILEWNRARDEVRKYKDQV